MIPDTLFIQKKILKYSKSIPETIKQIEVAFFGGSFTGIAKKLQKKLLSAVQPYIKSGLIKNIRLSTRPDYIDSEKLELLKNYNVKTIELGVQSFNEDVLLNAQRGHNAEDVYRAIEMIREYNFDLVIQLMPGLPGDNDQISLKNATISANLKPAGVRIYPTVILKDTLLEKLYYEKKYTPLSLEQAVHRSSLMLKIFNEKNIPVIRMGLHPIKVEELSSIIAGPYHTAFGFLVKARLKRNLLEAKIKNYLKNNQCNILHILIPDKNKEEYIGLRKESIKYLQNLFTNIKLLYTFSDKANIEIYGENNE